jgi:hypothetical protein
MRSANHAAIAIRRLHKKIAALPDDDRIALSMIGDGTLVLIAHGPAADQMIEIIGEHTSNITSVEKVPVRAEPDDPRVN